MTVVVAMHGACKQGYEAYVGRAPVLSTRRGWV